MHLVKMESSEVVQKVNECWNWSGYLQNGGYAEYGGADNRHRIHRRIYESMNGTKIPMGLQIDHLCRNRSCINPFHLEAVTGEINVLRGIGISAINARKTHCKRGHELKGYNVLYIKMHKDKSKLGRSCRTCSNMHQREFVKRKKAMKIIDRRAK